jgi:type IV pilus assembly protein PilB
LVRLRIGELLVSAKVITQEQLDSALKVQRPAGQRLGDLLVLQGTVTENQLTQTLGLQLSVPWVSLYHVDFSRQLLNLVPREVAEKFCVVPIFVRRVKKLGDTLYVAMDDPTNDAALAEIMTYAGLPVKPMIASPTDIRGAIRVYYGAEGGAQTAVVAAPPAAPVLVAMAPAAPVLVAMAPAAPPAPHAAPPAPPSSVPQVKPPLPTRPTRPAPPPPAHPSSGDSPHASPDIEAREVNIPMPKRGALPMVALTMLDGTTIHLPARKRKRRAGEDEEEVAAPIPGAPGAELLTARDLIRALRAVAQGADASAILGEDTRWEPIFAALLSLLLKKGIIADWEFIDELRAIAAAPAPRGGSKG